jgi:exonuclease SbcD
MRFIHTADWHLGRLFYGLHLTEDQAHVLDQLIDLAGSVRPDVVLVSGDIYDRAVPPPEAVRLLDYVLSRFILDLRIPVIMIAGNHDSPDRLGFGSKVMAAEDLHIFGSPGANAGCVTLHDKAGPVRFYAIPYAEPAVVETVLELEQGRDHQAVMAAYLNQVRGTHPAGERSVLVAHAFVAGGEESESERPLSVGGADRVSAELFEGVNYVALGHLHRPQAAGRESVRYAGSLLKYSFADGDQPRTVNLVEIDESGKCTVEGVALTPRRDVRRIEGHLDQFLNDPDPASNREDYLLVTLLDTHPILDLMGKLRQVFPNVLHVERPHLTGHGDKSAGRQDHRRMNDLDLFSGFFSEVTGDRLTTDQIVAYQAVVEELRRKEREVS